MGPKMIAFNPALGPSTRFCFPEQTTIHMKEKAFSLTSDDFTVKTVSGVEVCKCKGRLFSLADKKTFVDVDGHKLFDLKNKHFSLMKSFHAEGPDGKDLFVVTGDFSIMGSKSHVKFTNAADSRHVELEVKGDWWDRSANITWGGEPVAHVSRSFFNVREIFADKQTYFVTVAPNVDLTLIAAICVCLDERESDQK